jgi:hypothetical protein
MRATASLRLGILGILLSPCVAGLGCSASLGNRVVDDVVSTAYRAPEPPPQPFAGSPYTILAGDLHCHVAPPDSPPHVVRGLDETAALAKREGLDFVILTPHVWARFYEDDVLRTRVLAEQKALRGAVEALPAGPTTFIVGLEYTDGQNGHVGVSFGDLTGVLEGLPAAAARAHPEAFFERYVASGGLLVVNHPFATPTHAVVSISNADLSWRPFTGAGPFPPEIDAIRKLAQGYEAFNLTIAELRDHFLYFDRARSVQQTLTRVDREILDQRRPLFPVGGSDSHTHTLRATTFVLAKGRSPEAIHEALLAGRTCIRSSVACTLEARAPGGTWAGVGSRLRGVDRIELRTRGNLARIVRNGEPVGDAAAGRTIEVETPPGECSVVRAAVDEGWSAPIYVNCPM